MRDPTIHYHIQFQPLRAGASRPEDWGICHAYSTSNGATIPSVGDFVQLIPVGAPEGYLRFSGKVCSRLFRQFTHASESGEPTEVHVAVNIVVEESDIDWGKLIKE